MKNYYKITKVGNSLLAVLPSNVVKALGLQSKQRVTYEIIPGQNKVIMSIAPQNENTRGKSSVDKQVVEEVEKYRGILTVTKK
jgi:antitoxin component of MazEF toxin-antitoxin module